MNEGLPEMPDLPELTDEQSIVGVSRHNETGAFIVWMSLEGNDITPVGAWRDESAANDAMRETSEEFHRMVVAMDAADPDQADEVGLQHWIDFLEDMKQRSDAPTTPFSDEQLADIAQYLGALMKQRAGVPDPPEGMARVLVYSPEALAGTEMPGVQLSPMETPPPKKGDR